jgi:hypothetical protein
METKEKAGSKHLAAARALLDEIGGADDPQTKANAAVAHSILVLAEQVAVARVMMVTEAVQERANGQSQ